MIKFTPFERKHIELFKSWLREDHVKPFWQEPDDEIEEKFLHRIPNRGVKSFIFEIDSRPAGYIQYYDAQIVGGGWWENEKPGTFGIDVLLGEKDLLRKGFGTRVIQEFLEFLRTQEPNAFSVIIDPEPQNSIAIRTFEKAGFQRESEITTPCGRALLMRQPLRHPEVVERKSCRALLLTPQKKILLMQIADAVGGWIGWITPGGGINPNEDEVTALKRELEEELGVTHLVIGPKIWKRFLEFPWRGRWVKQHEVFFLVEIEEFTPKPHLNPDAAENAETKQFRWWTLDEIAQSKEQFAPPGIHGLVTGQIPTT